MRKDIVYHYELCMNVCFCVNSYKIFRCDILTLRTGMTDKCYIDKGIQTYKS
jgi:hypothetical protein